MTLEQQEKIEGLYRELFGKMMLYAMSFLHSEPLAEEAVQETFRIACQKPDQVCESPNPQGWIVNTLRNTVRDIRREQAATLALVERYASSQPAKITATEDGLRLELQYGNMAQTEEFRLLVEWAVEGRSHAQIAAARGISVDACKKRIQRAKEILRKKIKK